MFYESYKQAHEALGIPGSWQKGTQGNKEEGISSIKITANHSSLDRISSDMKTIFYVGIGKKQSQGEPAEHQTRDQQQPFFTSKVKQNLIPVLIKLKSGVVYFPGFYKVSTIYKKLSQSAKQYYEIKFINAENL